MFKIIKENFAPFIRGNIVGFIAGGSYVFTVPVANINFIIAYALKLVAAAGLALVSGFFTVLANDIYKHRIKKRLFKNGEIHKEDTDQDS